MAELPLHRLNRLIAMRGFCSRRKADDLIKAGLVMVNGKIVTDLSAKFAEKAEIEINGQILKEGSPKVYLAMNKPVQTVCTMQDPQCRKTVFELLPKNLQAQRPVPIGRLDYFSEGLLLLSNDGEFAQKLIHPKYEKIKKYEVTIRGKVDARILEDMEKGMTLADGTRCLPATVLAKPAANGNTLLIMKLRQGLNRQIRRMCQKWNLVILKLKRVSVGDFTLGNLKPGECREIPKAEVENFLKEN